MIFISYRQLDEPFGVGLLHSVLAERFPASPGIFLDTLANRRKRRVEKGLKDALADTRLMVCVVGEKFEELQRARQESGEFDWVPWEVQQAEERRIPVVPVLVRRQRRLTQKLPAALLKRQPSVVTQETAVADLQALADRLETLLTGTDPGGGTPGPRCGAGPGLSPPLVQSAVDAMLRHVLPLEQQRMRHLDNVVNGVVGLLAKQAWLEYLVTANLPTRPNGSALIVLTDRLLQIAEFDTTLNVHARQRVALPVIRDVAVQPYDRAFIKPMANMTVTTDEESIRIEGVVREAAIHLAELLHGPRPSQARRG